MDNHIGRPVSSERGETRHQLYLRGWLLSIMQFAAANFRL
jgi:hypothetical protein